MMKERTDICDCRVAFTTEKFSISTFTEYLCREIDHIIQTGTNQSEHYSSRPARVVLRLVCPGLYVRDRVTEYVKFFQKP